MSPYFFMMVGLPASGKSTEAENLCSRYNAVHISSDKIREEVFGNVRDSDHNQEVFDIMKPTKMLIKEEYMITVFTSPTCSKCKILKTKLQSMDIPFVESQDYDRMQGLMSLPAVEQEDGTIMTYEDAMWWLGLMERGNK